MTVRWALSKTVTLLVLGLIATPVAVRLSA
jgi:hypothetical protein